MGITFPLTGIIFLLIGIMISLVGILLLCGRVTFPLSFRVSRPFVCGQLDRVEDATRVLQGLVRKYPNYSEAHAALAAVLWKEDKRGAAEEEYSEASLQEPRFKNLMSVCLPSPSSMLYTTSVCVLSTEAYVRTSN